MQTNRLEEGGEIREGGVRESRGVGIEMEEAVENRTGGETAGLVPEEGLNQEGIEIEKALLYQTECAW